MQLEEFDDLFDLSPTEDNTLGGEEIALFYNGIFKMAFCWNIAQQLNPNSAGTGDRRGGSVCDGRSRP